MTNHIVIAITGGRDHIITWSEISEFHDLWRSITAGYSDTTLIHGGARGVDTNIALHIKDNPFRANEVLSYPVNCAIDGPWPRAGCNRNERMLNDSHPDILIAFPGRIRH